MSYRDKVEGNELDLSLNQLTEVPVKELASATKATHLDLSCNRIQTLPNDFATLTHLVKIDLSKNRLTELSFQFGNLYNLQHLDLYGNQIERLPVSFCRLKNLRWLDLKNNPLEPRLKNVAGDCLDEKECQACAKKVVAYMQSIDSDLEREKQKRLKAVRDKEALEKAKAERDLEEQRKQKKQDKERRKAESRAKKEAMANQMDSQQNNHSKNSGNSEDKKRVGKHAEKESSDGFSCAKLLAYSFVIIVLALLGSLFYAIHSQIITASEVQAAVQKASAFLLVKGNLLANESSRWIIKNFPKDFLESVRVAFLSVVHKCMINVTLIASHVEKLVAQYY